MFVSRYHLSGGRPGKHLDKMEVGDADKLTYCVTVQPATAPVFAFCICICISCICVCLCLMDGCLKQDVGPQSSGG